MLGRSSDAESQGLLAGNSGYEKVSASEPIEDHDDDNDGFGYMRTPGWKDRVRHCSWRSNWKMVLLAAVLSFVTIGFLVNSFTGVKNQKNISLKGDQGQFRAPVAADQIPVQDDDGTRLAYPPYDGLMPWEPGRKCGPNQVTYNPMTFNLEFAAHRNVSFSQDVKSESSPGGRDIHVSGDVVIRRSGSGTPGPSMVVETVSNDDRIVLDLDWDDARQRLFVLTPLAIPWSQPDMSPCLKVRTTIWVPPNSLLDSLNVEGVHLGVKTLDNLSLQLARFARFASTVGPIVGATDGETDMKQLMQQPTPASYSLDTRYIEIKTISASIAGSWPLYDYLGLETISGSITAGVDPKEALPEKPRPAILYARSTSGHIDIYEPIVEAAVARALQQAPSQGLSLSRARAAETLVPPRQYGVELYSMSGGVNASVAFGYRCKVHTTSGKTVLNLLPVLDASLAQQKGAKAAYLETSSTSGNTAISVMDALWRDVRQDRYVAAPTLPHPVGSAAAASPAAPAAPAMRVMYGRHTATSAALNVHYPPSWEGWIDADSLSGTIRVAGKDVSIIKDGERLPGLKRTVVAHKGPDGEGGMMKVHTTSGSIAVNVG